MASTAGTWARKVSIIRRLRVSALSSRERQADEESALSTSNAPTAARSTTDEIRAWALAAAVAADDKKAIDVVVLDVSETLTITDAFVIASATNTRLVATIAEAVEERVKAEGGPAPVAIEGLGEGSWVLMDFGGFVVHVFLDETRRYYDLERLWLDAPRIAWS